MAAASMYPAQAICSICAALLLIAAGMALAVKVDHVDMVSVVIRRSLAQRDTPDDTPMTCAGAWARSARWSW